MTLRILFSQTLILSVYLLPGCKESFPEPLASFDKDKSTARVGEPVSLTNTSQNAASYEWDFGDGNSSTEENPTHSYSSAGVFTITLTANGEGGTGLRTRSVIVWDLVLESIFYGDSIKFEGPAEFSTQPVKFIFNNQSSDIAAANLVKHNDGYSHQDMLNTFVDGISTAHHPNLTTEVSGVYKEIGANDSHTWIGNLQPGIYTLVSARLFPLTVWYVAGLTVKND